MGPEEVEQIINLLVEKLGPLGEHVWQIYVRQVYVNAFGAAIWGFVFFAGAIICGWWMRRAWRQANDIDRDFYMLVGGLGLFVCLGVFLMAFTFGVLQVVNPEYHAIQALLGR